KPHSPMGTIGFVARSVVVNATSGYTTRRRTARDLCAFCASASRPSDAGRRVADDLAALAPQRAALRVQASSPPAGSCTAATRSCRGPGAYRPLRDRHERRRMLRANRTLAPYGL